MDETRIPLVESGDIKVVEEEEEEEKKDECLIVFCLRRCTRYPMFVMP